MSPLQDEDPGSTLRFQRKEPVQILLVEDNRADVFLIQEALSEAGIAARTAVLEDGQLATEFIAKAGEDGAPPCPDVVLLDLNLPKKNGDEVLAYIRKCGKCKHTKVVIVTSSDADVDRRMAVDLRADGYFRKPSSYAEYMRLGQLVRDVLGL